MCIRLVLHTKQAHLRVVETVDFIGILRIDALNGHINVGLSGAEPYIANEEVGELYLSACTLNFHGVRSAGLLFRQVNAPMSVSVGGGDVLFLVEGDGNLFASIGFSPDGNGLATL